MVYFIDIDVLFSFFMLSPITPLTHHATLFVHHDRKSFAENLWEELRGTSLANIFYPITVLDIDNARELISWANTPYEGEKVALLSFHTITLPAQNALLKIIEEPRSGVQFILVTTNIEAIIPTLYSRLNHVKLSYNEVPSDQSVITFITTSHSERMKLPAVVSLLTKTDEEGRKDREGVRTFILSIIGSGNHYKEIQPYIEELLELTSYAGDPSASGKALIEYIALLLPQVKA